MGEVFFKMAKIWSIARGTIPAVLGSVPPNKVCDLPEPVKRVSTRKEKAKKVDRNKKMKERKDGGSVFKNGENLVDCTRHNSCSGAVFS
jgi:hypothetical protein